MKVIALAEFTFNEKTNILLPWKDGDEGVIFGDFNNFDKVLKVLYFSKGVGFKGFHGALLAERSASLDALGPIPEKWGLLNPDSGYPRLQKM